MNDFSDLCLLCTFSPSKLEHLRAARQYSMHYTLREYTLARRLIEESARRCCQLKVCFTKLCNFRWNPSIQCRTLQTSRPSTLSGWWAFLIWTPLMNDVSLNVLSKKLFSEPSCQTVSKSAALACRRSQCTAKFALKKIVPLLKILFTFCSLKNASSSLRSISMSIRLWLEKTAN